MKTTLKIVLLVLFGFYSNGVSAKEAQVVVKLISADWCGPCKQLEAEIKASGRDYIEIKTNQHSVRIPLLIVKSQARGATDNESLALGKLSDCYPEQQILVNWDPAASACYSDLHSITEFVKSHLDKTLIRAVN
jgi:thiol-disulfide isomerase/thioredoxin